MNNSPVVARFAHLSGCREKILLLLREPAQRDEVVLAAHDRLHAVQQVIVQPFLVLVLLSVPLPLGRCPFPATNPRPQQPPERGRGLVGNQHGQRGHVLVSRMGKGQGVAPAALGLLALVAQQSPLYGAHQRIRERHNIFNYLLRIS